MATLLLYLKYLVDNGILLKEKQDLKQYTLLRTTIKSLKYWLLAKQAFYTI